MDEKPTKAWIANKWYVWDSVIKDYVFTNPRPTKGWFAKVFAKVFLEADPLHNCRPITKVLVNATSFVFLGIALYSFLSIWM